MSKRTDLRTKGGLSALSRRRLIANAGFVAAAYFYLPRGLIQSANAQTVAETFDYYIGPNGSDQSPGTASQPWSITALNTKRTTYAGKRVGVLDGTYGLIDILGQPSGNWMTNALIVAGGTAASPTVVKAVNLHQAIIDGQKSKLTASAEQGLIGPGASYVTIDGLKIINANYQATSAWSTGNYLTVQNCWYAGQIFSIGVGQGENSATILMNALTGVTIRNNRFENGGAPSDGNRHSFILFYNSQDSVVEFNTISAIGAGGGNGIHFKATTDNKRMTVRFNYIDRTGSTNGTSKDCIRWHGNSGTDGFETCNNNIFIIASRGAPFMFEGASNTVRLYNNTLIGTTGWPDDGGFASLNLGNPTVNVYNNIFSRGAVGFQGDVRIPSITKVSTMDYNLYDNSPSMVVTDGNNGKWTGLAAWQTASGMDGHSQQLADPLFLRTGVEAEFYKLSTASVAKTLRGGVEVGAWGGATQVGCSFSGPTPTTPRPPIVVSAA